MSEYDDHVIPYEDAVRRHRALEADKRKGLIHEVKISDAMSHLLEEEAVQQDEGPTPSHLRSIVEREFADEDAPEDACPNEECACSLSDRPEPTPRG